MVLTTNVAGGVVVWLHGSPIACGADRVQALKHYEQLRKDYPLLPAVEEDR